MADIGELVVRIKADAAQLDREMRRANGVVQQNAGSMTRAFGSLKAQITALAPALSAAALVGFGRAALTQADHINDLALRTGFLGSTLSALNIPLKQSGSNLDEFTGSMVRMNNNVAEAVKGNQEQIKAFDALGLSVRKLDQLSPEQQFFEIAKALNDVESQSEFTNFGISIFGRSFATIAPLIKEADGNLADFVEKQKELGSALTDDQLARIDAWGDKWTSAVEHAKLAVVDFLDELAKVSAWINSQPDPSGQLLLAKVGIPPTNERFGPNLPRGSVSHRFPGTVVSMEAFGPAFQAPSARGSNAGLIKDKQADATEKAREALARYNTELQREHEFATMAPGDAAAKRAYYDTLEKAQKAGVKDAQALANANAEVARSTFELAERQQEAVRFAAELKDQFAETARSIVFDAKNAGDALTRLGQALAEMLIQKQVLGPLADSLFGAPGTAGGGIFGDLFGGFFADGGSPPVGIPSIVGEKGPEIFVPRTAGTVVPNKAIGGTSVTVVQHNTFGGGVTRQEVVSMLPAVANAAKQGVLHEISKGGSAAKMVGRRN